MTKDRPRDDEGRYVSKEKEKKHTFVILFVSMSFLPGDKDIENTVTR